ncbi:MAG: ROK family transcriptional regulator [Oscillospiraceae bacterium]|nr:ROK family transcriptional regulator [Oscillospiraceae bacterium]
MGENNMAVRKANKSNILYLLYNSGDMTRLDISQKLGLSVTTVSTILQELAADNLVVDKGQKASSGGRKPSIASLRQDARFSLGIHISRHHVRLVLLNLSSDTVARQSNRIPFENSASYWEHVNELANEFMKANRVPKTRFLGGCMSLPGIIDTEKEELCFSPTLGIGITEAVHVSNLEVMPVFSSITFAEIRSHFTFPLSFGNDADFAALAERWYRKSDDVEVYLHLGSGVGGSVAADESVRALLGKKACEFGHMTLIRNGRACPCGRRGCAEMYCSSLTLTVMSGGLSVDEFFQELGKGNSSCKKIWDTFLGYISTVLDNIYQVFDRPIVIGGEIAQYIKEYGAPLYAKLQEIRSESVTNRLRVGNYSQFDSAVGAALRQIFDFLDSF